MNDARDDRRRHVRGPWPGRHKVVAAVLVLTVALAGWWGVRLWQLRGSVARHRDYWSVARGESGGILYVALGDSTAQGIGASGPELGYVGLIARRLRAVTGRPVEVLNLSRSGARVRDVVSEQLPRLSALSPDVVTVTVGANDIRDYDGARFRADLDALLARLPPQTVVGDVPWFMHGGTGRKSGEAAGDLAARAQVRGLRVARLHRSMRQRGWTSMITDFAADWFHPNDRGYRVWAEAFWKALEGSGARPAEARSSPRGARSSASSPSAAVAPRAHAERSSQKRRL